MRSPADAAKAVREHLKNLAADQGDRLGIGINDLSKAFQPLRCVHGVADNRVVDPVWRADVTDDDGPHMDADPDANRLKPRGDPLFIVHRDSLPYSCGAPTRRFTPLFQSY